MITPHTAADVSPDVRALIVRQLGSALAAAWLRHKDERPEAAGNCPGRDVRGEKDREHEHDTTHQDKTVST